MKICILTQPLRTNYGGLLQAYALQIALKRMGHQVWTEDRQPDELSLKTKIVQSLKRGTEDFRMRFNFYAPAYRIIEQHTRQFIKNNIIITSPIRNSSKKELIKYKFDAYVVGSDQIWRPSYVLNIYNYFLDFTENLKVKRIAYAASFGTDEWEFTQEQTCVCKKLISNFDAVSVREINGVHFCKKFFDIGAQLVLDPTLLLNKDDYENLIDKDNVTQNNGDLMAYILDESPEKQKIINIIAEHKNLTPFTCMPKSNFDKAGRKHIEDCVYPPVTKWLKGFMDAKYIVTDSFHGCVFSIIFNKPFIVIGNKLRGIIRFTSLLDLFGIGSRLIYSENELSHKLIDEQMNYEKINEIIQTERQKSLFFLDKALS